MRVVCLCGKKLRVRDENSLRGAICPSCGCPVNTHQNNDPQKSPPKSRTSATGIASANYQMVRAESQDGNKNKVVRYQVVALDEPQTPQSSEQGVIPTLDTTVKRQKKRARRNVLADDNEWDFLFFPIYVHKPILFFTILLTVCYYVGLSIISDGNPNTIYLKWLPALGLLSVSSFYCLGFWFVLFNQICRGEFHAIHWQGRDSQEIFLQFLRGVICFATAPALLIAIAYYYWLFAGNINWIDYLLIVELLSAAWLFWFLAMFSINLNRSLKGLAPTAIVAMLGNFPWRKRCQILVFLWSGMLSSMSILIPVIWFGVNAATSILLFIVFMIYFFQVWFALLIRWFGLQCFQSKIQKRRFHDSETATA